MKLLKFISASCAKCDVVSQFLMSKNVSFDVIDVQQNQACAGRYGIHSVPTTILLTENDVELARSVGVNPPELIKILAMYQKESTGDV